MSLSSLKNLSLKSQFAILGVAVLAFGVFIAVQSSQQNQENRSNAAQSPNAPTANAVRVVCDTACGTGDDTAKFQRAITTALSSPVRYANGPIGPQAVVYVPAGTYRLLELTFPSNLRMEVDAGAVLEQAGGTGVPDGAALIRWDGPVGAPLKNVSLVGVGSSSGGLKTKSEPVESGWAVDNSFTFNMDPQATQASEKSAGLQVLNTQGFLIANVFSIENDFRPADAAQFNAHSWPTSQKAVLGLRGRGDSPCVGTFAIPKDGKINNWYNIQGPKGYGPNQVGGAQNVSFNHIFTQGGTALRLETDSSQASLGDKSAGKVCPNNKTKFGSEIRGLTADDIHGRNCNRAVSFTPHTQDNYDVHVTNVVSTSCAEAVVESKSTFDHQDGSFNNSTLANVNVIGGDKAQLGTSGAIVGYWTIGKSLKPFTREAGLVWAVTYSGTIACSGSFQQLSDIINTSNGTIRPNCSSSTISPTITTSPTTSVSPPITVVPTLTTAPTQTVTPTLTPTTTVVPGNTAFNLNLLLHGIGQGGDSANPAGGGNPNPHTTQRNVTIEVYSVQNLLVLTKNGVVNFNPNAGNFSGSVDMGNAFSSGQYTVKIKTNQFLKALVPGIQTITKGTLNTLPQTVMVNGDINGDNSINILDYNILMGCYSDLLPAGSCTPENKILSDLDDDGNINQFDYTLFLRELSNIRGQ